MPLDAELDLLIQSARGAEEPPAHARAQVRRGLQRQLQSGVVDLDLERAVVPSVPPRAGRRLPRAVSWGVPLAAIGAAALVALRLSPQAGDPLVHAPVPPPVPVIAAPQAPSLFEPEAAPGSSLLEGQVVLADPTRPAVSEPAPGSPAATPPVEAKAGEAAREAVRQRTRKDAEAERQARSRPPNLLEESRALEQVQRALNEKQYWRALELLEQQDSQFAAGQLGQERAVARALASCMTGNAVLRAEVQRLARNASGLYADRLRGACPEAFAGEPAPAGGSAR